MQSLIWGRFAGLSEVEDALVSVTATDVVGNIRSTMLSDGQELKVYASGEWETFDLQASTIAIGRTSSYYVIIDKYLYSWGDNNYGCLGLVTSSRYVEYPTLVNLLDVVALFPGSSSCIAQTIDGTLAACGRNYDGCLGIGRPDDVSMFVPLLGLTDVLTVSRSSNTSAALTLHGQIYWWGNGRMFPTLLKFNEPIYQMVALGGKLLIVTESGDYLTDGKSSQPVTLPLDDAVISRGPDYIVFTDGNTLCLTTDENVEVEILRLSLPHNANRVTATSGICIGEEHLDSSTTS
jgi:hypothetical protein